VADTALALIVGANRGIGLGVTREFLARGWSVIATARQPDQASALRELAERYPGRIRIDRLDMNDPGGLDAFASDLADQTLDIVLVNAGVAGPDHRSATAATEQEIGRLMFTNAIAPIRLSRRLMDRIRRDSGVLGFTSSVMGSVALNPGGHELYRASKAALNSLTRGLHAEMSARKVTVLTLHPGWVRTDMGGPIAAVSVEDSARGMVEVMLSQRGGHRHRFLDYLGKEIAW
jgi:NAD(P)-dependent dehydrogenase (short-subunit alcohol dehydrogenase family)